MHLKEGFRWILVKNFEKIETALYGISVMKEALYRNYTVLVEGVISGELKEPETIREILHGISEFLGEERFRELERRLCRYVEENLPEISVWRLR